MSGNIPEEFIITRQGKQYILYAGLLHEAHQRGLRSIETELLQIPSQENGQVAIVHAVVRTEGGKFSGIGDASPENVGRNIVPHIIRMAECVRLSAQALTRDGWKLHDELSIGEEVLAYDCEADECRWVPLLAVRVFEESPLVRLSSRSFDAVCTPDHRWIVENVGWKGKRTRRERHTHELKTSDSIVVAAKAKGGDHPLSQRDAAILGWLATDGSLRYQTVGEFGPYPRAYIQQSKPNHVDEIRELLGDDAYESVEQPREGGHGIVATKVAHRFSLKSGYLRHLLETANLHDWPDLIPLVTRLSEPARANMLDAMLKGDGHLKRGKYRVFGKGRKTGVMQAFEILATLEGVALGVPSRASKGDVPLRTLRENRLVNTNYLKQLPEAPEKVWCPTTPLDTWVMRDSSGTITISGNTRAKARAFRDAVDVGAEALEDAVDEDTAVAPVHQLPHPPANKSQKDLLRTLAQELRGENGVERLEKRIGKPIDELTKVEADEWIDRLTPFEAEGEQ